ncbi:MAG TPA: antibiotic biosynthesis monooxygenase [Novosphingobium sp.]|nr:antibiotic biosynthesis monooxygenase [Novosphingobium sp.]
MYLTVFRNRKRPDMDRAAYEADNARMEELAASQPGFIAIKGFVAEDGEVVAISEWESEEAAKAWGSHPEHARVQARGRADYYESYTLYSCTDPKVRRYERARP